MANDNVGLGDKDKANAIGARNRTLDILKAVAIILIVVTHFDWTGNQRNNIVFPYIVNMAVPTFMFISGYVGAMSMERNHVCCISQAYTKEILIRKLLRYVVPFSLIVIWNIVDPNITTDALSKGLFRWIMNGTDGPGSYYFPVLIQFVFVFPLIYFIVKREGKKGVYICLLIDVLYGILKWAWGMNYDFWRNMVFRYVFIIAIGVFSYIQHEDKNHSLSSNYGLKENAVCMTCVGGVFIYLTTYHPSVQSIVSNWFDWTGGCCFASMWIAPFLILAIHKGKWKCKAIEYIGKCSYEIFLFQMGYYLAYDTLIQHVVQNQWLHLGANIVICCLAGIILHLIDEVVLNTIMKVLKNKKIA